MSNGLPEILTRRALYQSRWVSLYVDSVAMPGGRVVPEHHFLAYDREGVSTLMTNKAGQVLFIESYRYTVNGVFWELPAGDTEPGESILETAVREGREESGYEVCHPRHVYTFNPLIGMSNKKLHVVFAEAGESVGEFDVNEVRSVRWFSPSEAKALVAEGAIKDGLTLVALLLFFSGLSPEVTDGTLA